MLCTNILYYILSDRTAKIKLYETKYHKCFVKQKHRNSRLQCQKRLAWCKLNRHKTVNDFWKEMIYSAECKVELVMDNRILIWRRPGEEWTPPCLNPGLGVRVNLMIWDCITYEGVGTLTVVGGYINAPKYIEVIDNLVWPIIARHFADDNYLFQDDNAPYIHAVKEYMEET